MNKEYNSESITRYCMPYIASSYKPSSFDEADRFEIWDWLEDALLNPSRYIECESNRPRIGALFERERTSVAGCEDAFRSMRNSMGGPKGEYIGLECLRACIGLDDLTCSFKRYVPPIKFGGFSATAQCNRTSFKNTHGS